MKNLFLTHILTIIISTTVSAQIIIDVNLNTKHTVGNISTFEREKFITVHSAIFEGGWNGEEDKFNYLVNDLDAYLSRETGRTTSTVTRNNVEQIARQSTRDKERYAANTARHKYESHEHLIVCTQHRVIEELEAHEAGLRYATYAKEYFGNGGEDGPVQPKYFELINEPLFPFVDWVEGELPMPIPEIFEYHKEMSIAFKEVAPDLPIGGYVCAFPVFEENDFKRWEERWKMYIDSVGDYNDFYSVHLYDFPGIGGGKEQYRKGANIEATLDMLEHYGTITNKQRDFVISEYGSQLHDWYHQPWSAYRDWLCIKSFNNMMLQFMERPDKILKTLPFTVIKAEWGYNRDTDAPYYWRMMRKENEPESYTGDWVWSEYIKFYELWKDVKGTRIETKPADINIQTDAFVDGNKAYIIVNNLQPDSKEVKLNLPQKANSIKSVEVRNLYLDGDAPVLDISEQDVDNTLEIELKPEATVIYVLSYTEDIDILHTCYETKYYATEYLKPIAKDTVLTFDINGIVINETGEAVLRIGIGRDHGQSLEPQINVNGNKIVAKAFYRGDDQEDRNRFFGLLEIEIPYSILEKNNKVEIEFPDSGGHASSVALQVLNFSVEVERGF